MDENYQEFTISSQFQMWVRIVRVGLAAVFKGPLRGIWILIEQGNMARFKGKNQQVAGSDNICDIAVFSLCAPVNYCVCQTEVHGVDCADKPTLESKKVHVLVLIHHKSCHLFCLPIELVYFLELDELTSAEAVGAYGVI